MFCSRMKTQKWNPFFVARRKRHLVKFPCLIQISMNIEDTKCKILCFDEVGMNEHIMKTLWGSRQTNKLWVGANSDAIFCDRT